MLDGLPALAAILLELYFPFNSFLIFAGIVIPHTANGAFQAY